MLSRLRQTADANDVDIAGVYKLQSAPQANKLATLSGAWRGIMCKQSGNGCHVMARQIILHLVHLVLSLLVSSNLKVLASLQKMVCQSKLSGSLYIVLYRHGLKQTPHSLAHVYL